MSNEGKRVRVHYKGTFNDGKSFDSSYDRNEPLCFTCMQGQMIPGFDEAVRDMKKGEIKKVTLSPSQGYGEREENKIAHIQFEMLPGADKLEIGQSLRVATAQGVPMPCVVVDKDETSVTLDMNHPLAGKELTFEIELLDVDGE